MSPRSWPNLTSRPTLAALAAAAWLLGGGAGCGLPTLPAPATALAADAAPVTLLVGQSWLGLWQNGKLQRRADAKGWEFNAVRLSADGKTLEVAAYPLADRNENKPSVLRYELRTLALVGRKPDATAGQWQPLPPPVGTDSAFVPPVPGKANLETGTRVVSVQNAAWLTAFTDAQGATALQVRHTDGKPFGPAHPLPGTEWRAALSPDGSTVAVFTPGNTADQAWQGTAWTAATDQTIKAPGLTIDDGSTRENGAPRALACLLPHGEGAIFTYLGAPADRYSEFQSFAPGAGAASMLNTTWVMGCLSVANVVVAGH